MKIKYSRLESAGNNFILLDYLDNSLPEFNKISKLIFDSRELSNSDGLLIITKSRNKDFELDFYNPDSSPSFCGNGSICAVKYYSKFYLNKNYEFYSNGVRAKLKRILKNDRIRLEENLNLSIFSKKRLNLPIKTNELIQIISSNIFTPLQSARIVQKNESLLSISCLLYTSPSPRD